MKSLFSTIESLPIEKDFSVSFAYHNIFNGWQLMDVLKCDELTKKKLVKLVAYRYSYESPLLKKKKDAFELKCEICKYLELEIDDFVMDCIRNNNYDFECYVTWWLKTNGDRDFAILSSLEDELYEQLQMVRTGISSFFNIEAIKDLPSAMSMFKKLEVSMKGSAAKRASELRKEIDYLYTQLEKKYDSLYSSVKSESPTLAENISWAERWVIKNRSN